MSFRKAILLGLLVSLVALSLGVVGCSSEEAALTLTPNPVAANASTEIEGSGFVPNKAVAVLLVGTWTFKGGDIVDPGIDGAIADADGAFCITASISKLASNYGVAEGTYTVKAVQDDRVATASLEVDPAAAS
jgi:hypothetical protein